MEVTKMWAYIVCGIIWILSLITIIKERLACETYAHIETAVFFTSLFFNLEGIGKFDIANILWLEIIGFLFFIPSAFLIISSFIAFDRKGEAKTSFLNPSQSTALIDTGILGIVRHPIYLGTALGAFALILVFQSIISLILGIIAIFCLWMASKKEDEFNMKKFGDKYKEYMKKVPIWNVFKGLRK
jgi:protein-S-isoprenylcysteine O-methyltransferase Ste14